MKYSSSPARWRTRFPAGAVSRSIRTLNLRMPRHLTTQRRLAQALEADRRVCRVVYPGLKSHPQHELASRIFEHGCGAMLSIYVPEDGSGSMRFCTGCATSAMP